MTSSTLSPPISQRGWFDVLDDWLKQNLLDSVRTSV